MATSITALANMSSSMLTVPRSFSFRSSTCTPSKLHLYPSNAPNSNSSVSRRSSSRCSINPELASMNTKVAEHDPSLAVKNKAAEISSELKGTSIFLVGMNNTIKTKLGNVLADALRYYYFDSDNLVEQAGGGVSTAESLRERDEKGFLDSETEVLRQLSSMGRLVVCAGDGAVQSSRNLALLRHGISMWIDIPPAYALSTSDHPEALVKLTAKYERMKDDYTIADATVSLQKLAYQLGYDDMDAVVIEDLALEALKEIEKLTRVKKMMEAAARPF